MISITVVCVLIEAIFTAMEVSFGTVPKSRLRSLAHGADNNENHQAQRAAKALALKDHNDQLILLFLTVTCVTMWSAATLLFWWLHSQNYSLWWILAAMAIVLFVAEVVPLVLAARFAEFIALHSASLLRLVLQLLFPLLWLIGTVACSFAWLVGANKNTSIQLTEDELRSAIAVAAEEGVLDSHEQDMLEMAMDFRTKLVREVMTPRPDIIAVAEDISLSEALRCSLESGHSNLPVYHEALDKITGILSIKDILPLAHHGNLSQRKVGEFARSPYFIPEDKHIASTLEEMRRGSTLTAIVVDAEGTTTGIVTAEDLLEELVGEIQDEYDNEDPIFQIEGPGKISCDASVTVRELERFWEQQFDETAQLYDRTGEAADDSISLAALALNHFDGIPAPGSKITLGDPCLSITVVDMDGPRIEKVLLQTDKPLP